MKVKLDALTQILFSRRYSVILIKEGTYSGKLAFIWYKSFFCSCLCINYRLNIRVLESSSKQPDFGGNVLENSNWVGPVLVEEVKGEDRKDDMYMYLMDLYRISSLSVESINQNRYKGVVGIQMIGMQATFYVSTFLSKGFYVMTEICSITLSKDLTKILSYFANVSDLLPVIWCYENCFELVNNVMSESCMDTFDAKNSYVHQKIERENAQLFSTISRSGAFFLLFTHHTYASLFFYHHRIYALFFFIIC